ncbi:MAG: TonB-dependent receptor [Gammaproteobacteria bacterium]|nr:TonB-dependent receptor [Gammaproteobacteria bacterium]
MIATRQTSQTSAGRTVKGALATAIALALGGASVARASDPGDSLAEIVVTANHRAQSVLDVPYNITAVSGDQLKNADVVSLHDIARLLPGVTIPDLGPRANSSNSLIIIRGLNVNDPVNSAYLPWGSVPTVSTYVDNVPVFVDLRMFDIERIEVLRGPQGTLYGSGAVGGTVKILHNPPRLGRFSAELSTDVSQTKHAAHVSYDTQGIVNLPVGQNLAIRLSANYEKSAGYIDAANAVVFDSHQQPVLADPANPLTSGLTYQRIRGIDGAQSSSVRVAALWEPVEWLNADFAYQRQDDHANGFSHQTAGSPQLAGYNYVTQTLIPNEPDHRVVDLDSMTLTADAGFATVVSSTSYSVDNDANVYDESQFVIGYNLAGPTLYGNYPRVTSPFINSSHDTALTQELRLVSKAGGPWDYAVGGFFQHQTEHLYQYETVPGFAAWSELPGSGAAIPSTVAGAPYSTFGDFVQYYNGGTRPSALSPVDENFTYLQLSGFLDRAVYGELTRHVTPRWQITGGTRLFWQNFAQSLYSTIPYGGPYFSTLPPPANATDALGSTIVQRAQSFHNHLFKLNTSYKIASKMRIYATFSEGFRHGGVNALPIGNCIFCESASLVPYRSDSVKNYEVGFKGVTGGKLNFSAAIYRVNWNDVQIQVFGQAGDPVVVNGKSARSQGVELELGGPIGGGWTFNFGYGFTDAKIMQDFAVTEPLPGSGSIYTVVAARAGDRLPYVPRQTLTADLGYTRSLTETAVVDAHVDAAYRSNVATQIDPTVLGYRQLGGFTTINGAVGLALGTHWHLRVFVNNLTNVLGVTSAGSLYRGYDDPRYRIENVARPRTIGVGAAYKFR